MKKELLPQVQFVPETDLAGFAGALHVLAGDYLRDMERNMDAFRHGSPDFIAIMGNSRMCLYDAPFAYQSGAELHQRIFTAGYLAGSAFLFHAERQENGRPFGSVIRLDLETLCEDVEAHTIFPIGKEVEYPDGRTETVSLRNWAAMELYEKDALKSWGEVYSQPDLEAAARHYAQFSAGLRQIAFSNTDEGLLDLLNVNYMEQAQNSQEGFYRIPMGTAKELLLSGEASVYRLLPSGPEKIAPITAVTTGLWFEQYREFAVAPEDLGALDKLIRRETDRLIGNQPQLHKNTERRPSQER